MRTYFSSIACILLGLGGFASCQWSPSNESTVESYWLRGDTLLIRLRDGSGWRLDIYQGGRGNIRYGRHPNNLLTFKNAGFNFDSLRWRFTGSSSKNRKKASFPSARIAFLSSDTEVEQSKVLQQPELGREVFYLAFEAGLNSQGDLRAKRRMLKLFKTNPPFRK